VPDQILNKPGALSDEEWESIQQHPIVGWDLAQRAPSLHGSLDAIRHHHERWDGTGYPDRLEAADIPLAGRIVGVADVWDALTSDRAYRPAWDPERAISHIAAGAGMLFDPLCVEAFLDVVSGSGTVRADLSADVEALFRETLARHPGVANGDGALRGRRPPVASPGS
jgi:HD-GYP domain-containing protein (c-di-GMP phosphodiesterase class II)